MPSPRQRPLTWLFFAALLCLNVVALTRDYHSDWYADLVVSQLYIAACWLALGHAHRLARASALAAVLAITVAPDYIISDAAVGAWRYVLGSSLVLVVGVAVSCWMTILCVSAHHRDPTQSHRLWHFDIAEILGWMTLVAIASVAVPRAEFRHLNNVDSHWLPILMASSAAGCLSTVFLRPTKWGRIPAVAAGPAVIATSIALTVFSMAVAALTQQRFDYTSLFRAYIVLGVWIVVQRLDEQFAMRDKERASNAPSSLKLFNTGSDDQRRGPW